MNEELKAPQGIPELTLDAVPAVPTLTLSADSPAPAMPAVPAPAVLNETALSPEEQKVVDDFAEKIDISDSTLVLQYGSGAQKKIASFSDTALENVRTKDLGEVGEALSSLVVELKGCDVEEKKGIMGFFQKKRNEVEEM
ncbi:MAG: toxic anion resistance protein, partial [Oscillospiraceae bacterium]